ncbi:MAG: LptF/LptG family permease [Endomicrobium sp.]|jgi:lipopolysaccharide export system permease protein|nr:LptF/LptG family permease [Endomicrobium sp.]
MIKKLHLYVIKEFFSSLVFGVSVFSVLLLLDRIFDFADLLLSKRVPFIFVLKLFIFILPNILTIAVPMAVLFGILLSYGRFSEDNEITAMKSLGLSCRSMSIPIIITVCGISFFLVFFNHFVSPSLNSNFKKLYEKILIQRPFVKFNEKTLMEIGNYRLYANNVNNKNNTLSEVSIYKMNNSNDDTYDVKNDNNILLHNNDSKWRISAASARVKIYQNGLRFILYNGCLQKISSTDINNMIHMTFKSYCFFMPIEHICRNNKKISLTIREMSSPTILKVIKKCEKQGISSIEYRKEFWFRWIFAIAPISFVVIALPIGIMSGKNGKAISFGISLGIILLYYILLMLILMLSDKKYISIGVTMWVPNFIITTIGIYLFIKMCE